MLHSPREEVKPVVKTLQFEQTVGEVIKKVFTELDGVSSFVSQFFPEIRGLP